ncbi:hypothetical protein ACIOJE_39550 [Kitasatospora sp. NPDC087861]|uniref:hypothetical protein n=1 Tax=Kitasatospora sp. NPDC087861 TaxID=3364070 RepID=UPI003813D887
MTINHLAVELENGDVIVNPDRRDLTSALNSMSAPDNEFMVISWESDPEEADSGVFIQVLMHDPESWQAEYREGSHDRYFQAADHQPRKRTEELLLGWISGGTEWLRVRQAISWVKLDPSDNQGGSDEDGEDSRTFSQSLHGTRLVKVAHEPTYRTATIGTYREGLFFADIVSSPTSTDEVVLLHLFDADGNHTRSALKPAADLEQAKALLESTLAGLEGLRYEDIHIRPFSIENEGHTWGLLDETALRGGEEWYELEPQGLAFHAPWNGEYDT